MNRWLVGGAVALCALAFVPCARADTKTLAQAGAWKAFGGTTDSGRGVCGMSANVDDQYFGLKFYAGDDTFTIQVGTGKWKIDDRKKQQVVVLFDANAPWNASGIGMHFSDGDAGIQFEIMQNELPKFMSQFRGGKQMRLRFPSFAADWTFNLMGTNSIYDEFQGCVLKLK